MTAIEVKKRSGILVQYLADGCNHVHGLTSLTPAVYDTAWVSMISKDVDDIPKWLFPECFHFILDTQLPNGGWESYASDVDGILNTMAALLAMKRHQSNPGIAGNHLPSDMCSRISQAITFLENQLKEWDVGASIHVGFEVLVPALLAMLEDEYVSFDFPGRQALMALNKKKLEKFDPRMVTGKSKTTLLHSLEAFVGKIDVDCVRHHKTFGSMMCSPSSTAAYLMNVTSWDLDAEDYLRHALSCTNRIPHGDNDSRSEKRFDRERKLDGEERRSNGVPSAFPTSIFEVTWVRTVLIPCVISSKSWHIKLTKYAGYFHPSPRWVFCGFTRT